MENNQPSIPETNDLPPAVPGQEFQAPEVSTNIPPVENKSPEVPPTPKAKSKLIPVLLIILILSVLGVGGLYAYKNFFAKTPESPPTPISTPTPTPDPTANWKTYTNSDIGFSFKYPNTWTAGEPPPEDKSAIVNIEADEKFGTVDVLVYQVRVSRSDKPSVQKYTDLHEIRDFLSGATVYKTEQELSRSGMLSYFFSEDGNTFIEISLDPYSSQNPLTNQGQYAVIFDQILSTFKFTDTSVTDQRSIVENFVKAKVFSYGKSHGLTSENQIIVRIDYLTDSLAAGGIGFTPDVEGSGEAWYAAKISGQWNMVLETQQPPTCNVMAQYGFPKSVYGECTTIVD